MSVTSVELYKQLIEYVYKNDPDFRAEFDSDYGETLEEFLEDDDYVTGEDAAGWDALSELLYDGDIELDGHTVTQIDERTGGDENGTLMWLILKVTDDEGDDQFFKKEGYWVSHDGGYWEGPFTEVKPHTVERIEYY